jgi:dihydroorotate dehydrogenase (NAD+) catalytic subunit
VSLLDLPFTGPIANAAGFLGFHPNPREIDTAPLGAVITNPVSLGPRTAASGARLIPFPGGVLIHTGYPNPGLRRVISANGRKWARSKPPVIVHLIAADPDDLFRMVRILEETEGVAGLEIGLAAGTPNDPARALVQAAVGELPILVRPAMEDALRLAGEAADAGASALTIGPARGSLPGPDGAPVSGRIYGPAVRPQALEILREVVGLGIPVICSGGIVTPEDVETTLALGAAGVQVDTALWKSGGFRFPAGSSSVRG